MRVFALTGNIASGKSSVARLFADCGATIIDADLLARAAVAPGAPALAAIAARWGPSVLAADGSLDRAALRHIVFASPAERAALDAIVHPEVARLRLAAVADARDRGLPYVICDIPLLFETGLDAGMDAIVLVDAPESIRRERLMRDRALSAAEADAMLAAQWPVERKRAKADWVIDNAGTREELAARAHEVFNALRSRSVSP